MAENAQAPPTFKLVLVGDGGTGKASNFFLSSIFSLLPKGKKNITSLLDPFVM